MPEARSSKILWVSIRYAVRALEYMACGGKDRGKPRPSQVVDCCGDNTGVIWGRVVFYSVYMG